MGWGVTDYPQPRESDHDTCSNGCAISAASFNADEIYACYEKGCAKDHLCVGCIWQCADCSDDFCEAHIEDLMNVDPAQAFTVFLCASCLAQRLAASSTTAAREAA